jgi:hypothetical protein
MIVELHLSVTELPELIGRERRSKRRQWVRRVHYALDGMTADEITAAAVAKCS